MQILTYLLTFLFMKKFHFLKLFARIKNVSFKVFSNIYNRIHET